MRTIILLLLPLFSIAQTNDGRVVVALRIMYPPDNMEGNKYYLIVEKPSIVLLKPNQTFLLQSAWQQSNDSVVNIGAGTVKSFSDTSAELTGIVYPGKKIREGDMAMFLVPLVLPFTDTLFFKLARNAIGFKNIYDSSFYERNSMLKGPETYPTQTLLDAMAKDIRFTGKAMMEQKNSQDQPISSGNYKGQMLFDMMQKTTANDVLHFIRYVYARPDKYKAHEWRISETFATWVINGAPSIR